MDRRLYFIAMLLVVASSLFCFTESSGKLHIHFLQYQSDGLTADGIRCDPLLESNDTETEIDDPCDPQFQVNVEREMKGGENIFSYLQSNSYNNRETIDFMSDFAEKPNPMVVELNYDDNQGNVWLEVIVRDHDLYNEGQLMSKFGADLEVSGDEVRYKELKSKGKDRLTLRYWFSCNTNYFGPQCNKHCVGHNDDVNGHIWCDSTGDKFCRFGWIDIRLNCKTPHPCRTCVCQNGGHCIPRDAEGYRCQCSAGFYGVNCENCDIGDSRCRNRITDPGTRNCDTMRLDPTSSTILSCHICTFLVLLSCFITLYLRQF